MRMVQLVRRHYPVPWYRVPCTMVLYHGTGYPVPWYRATLNYARIIKPFYEVIYDMGFFREFSSKVIG